MCRRNRRPRERFVEVELLIRAAAPTEERFGLTLLDSRGSDAWLEALDKSFYPVGIAAESLGQRVLAKSSGQVVAFVPDRDSVYTLITEFEIGNSG